MKTEISQKNMTARRIAACAGGMRLVKISPERQGMCRPARAFHKSIFLPVLFPPSPAPKDRVNLTRREIFRGKISCAKLKNKNTPRTKDAFAPNL
jgi:hypothetical protein